MRHIISDEGTIHDRVTFRAGDENIELRVDKNGREIIRDLMKARNDLQKVTEESGEEALETAARSFASAMFGEKQAEMLFGLYRDTTTVVNVCGQYFARYLSKKITKVQKR